MISKRYGARGRGISGGQLLALIAAQERQERLLAETAVERAAFRRQVREAQLRCRVEADPADGIYTAEQIEHARVALAELLGS